MDHGNNGNIMTFFRIERHRSNGWRGKKDQSHRREVLRTQYSIREESISEVFRALFELGITNDDVLNSYPQTGYTPARPALHCLGEEGLTHTKSPILSSSQICHFR